MGKTNFNESDAEIVQYLADGYTVKEVAKEMDIKVRTLEAKLAVAKKRALATTLYHLVANYFRKGLIK